MASPAIKALAADTMTKVREAQQMFGDDDQGRAHCENIVILALLTAQADALSATSRDLLATSNRR